MALRVIITGGPGAGKTTLINVLRRAGARCCAEVSRALIEEEHDRGGTLLPWNDIVGFAAACEQRMRQQCVEEETSAEVLFDRGLPDIIAYLRHRGEVPSPELVRVSRWYSPVAFVAPPWPEIFAQDAARPQSFAESCAIHAQLVRAYEECGFQLIELPRAPVEARAAFVVSCLKPWRVAPPLRPHP